MSYKSNNIPFCIKCVPHFHYQCIISKWASRLFLISGYCECNSNELDNQVSLKDVGSLEYLLKSGKVISYGRLALNFLRNIHVNFCGRYTSLHFHQQWINIPQPHQHVLFFVLLILAILAGVIWNLKRVLLCISLIPKQLKYFKRFSAICVSPFENSLILSIPHFFI